MTKAQLTQWKQIYARSFARISKKEPGNLAAEQAAKIAWKVMKAKGVKTKWDVLGTRTVDILRDTGLLFNSLQPGILSEQTNGSASYSPTTNQIADFRPGRLVCGTSVSYAKYHQNGKRTPRLFWPQELPPAWIEHINDHVRKGLIQAIMALAKNPT